MAEPRYTYWVDNTVDDDPIYLRRYPGGSDLLTDGRWVKVNPADWEGEVDPWADKIGKGDAIRVPLEKVPVREGSARPA